MADQPPRLRIVKVVLQNVKSYAVATTVELAPGVNAVCGENGAGKSTILEAIGYALFGYRPYKLDAFLREGEKSGSIAVTVEDGNGCTFDVVRKIGSSGAQAVYNELGQKIAEGEADVRGWLLELFHLDPGADIARLFEDTIGPPQGTLTAIFLESAATRAKKFDRLLGIEDYQAAWEGLRPVSGLFRDEAEEAGRRAALLEGDVRRLPEVEAERSELIERQVGLGAELQGLLHDQEGLAARRDELDRVRQTIQAAETQLSFAEARSKEAQRRQEDLAAQLAQTEEAARVLDASRPGYLACRGATERLRQLEARRRERDGLRHKAEMADRTALQWEQQRESAVEKLDVLARDADLAAERERLVPEQEAREKAVQEAEGRLRARDEATRQSEAVEERIRTAEGRLREARLRLAEVEAAKPVAAELEGLREKERSLRDERARLDQQSLVLEQSGESLIEARGRLAQLLRETEPLVTQVAQLRPLEPLVSQAVARQQERDAAAAEFAALDARHKEAVRTRAQVEGGLCPFFHERCLNLRGELSLDTHFDGVISATAAELDIARNRLKVADAGLSEARTAERSFSRLPDLERQLQQLNDSRAKLESEVERLETLRSELSAIPEERARVESGLRELGPRLAGSEAAWKVVSGEAGWRSQAEEAAGTLERERAALEQLHAAVESAAGIEDILDAARAALSELRDPRAEAALLRQRVAREYPNAERARDRAEKEAALARAAEEEAKKALEPFAQLEDEIATATAQRDGNQPAYNSFLANQQEAERLDARRSAHQKAAQELEQAAEALKAATLSVEALRTSYDEAEHLAVRQQLDEVGGNIAAIRTEMDLKRREEERLLKELASLRERKQEMEAIQKQAADARQLRDAVEAIRSALKTAGPEIGKALRRRISDRATGLYRELLGQPTVSLEWGDDYGIRTRIRTEDREFKQLSGGEQMAAALAVRLALLQTISNLRVAFLDEPTAHMDATRRTNLAAQIQNLRSFDQLVVISHDDSFDTLFGHVVRLVKRDGATVVEN